MVRYQTSTWQGKFRAVPMSDMISWNVQPIESYQIPVLTFAVTRVVLLDNQVLYFLGNPNDCHVILFFTLCIIVTLSHLS
jgi:hypothetical protein